jgi:predicted GIY-YIG superfamily endonuclease
MNKRSTLLPNTNRKQEILKPGLVYVLYDENDRVLYVGETANIEARLYSHMISPPYKTFKKEPSMIVVYDMDCGRLEREIVEKELKKELKPLILPDRNDGGERYAD